MPTPTTDNRSTFILSSAACLRFLTVADVMTLLGSTYDMASRELARLAEADPPLLDTFRPPVGRGQGSVPVIYVLSGNGARVLADAGVANIENLSRIVKNVGTRRRDVEAGNPTQIRHALEITHLVSLLWRGLWDRDPHARLSDVYYDRELNCSLSAADVAERLPTLAEREKLQRSQDGTACAYIPDFFFAVTWSPDGGAQRRDAFALEVETGYGQRDPVSIGTQKAAKIGVLVRDFHRTGKIGPLAFPIAPDFKVLFWVREQPFEEGITQGALSVQRAGKNPIVSTNGELLPLAAPLGTEKKALPASVRELSQRLFTEEIWQFLAYRDTRLSLLDPPIGPVIGTEPGA